MPAAVAVPGPQCRREFGHATRSDCWRLLQTVTSVARTHGETALGSPRAAYANPQRFLMPGIRAVPPEPSACGSGSTPAPCVPICDEPALLWGTHMVATDRRLVSALHEEDVGRTAPPSRPEFAERIRSSRASTWHPSSERMLGSC